MFGLERITAKAPIVVRDYKPNRLALTIGFNSDANEIVGIPKAEIPNEEIWLPGNTAKTQAFLSTFLGKLGEIPGAAELASSISIHKEEKLFLGEVSYETSDGNLKILSIQEIKSKDEPDDIKAEETLSSGKLPFKVSYIVPSNGDPFVEIYVLTLHPEMRVNIGNLIQEKILESS